MRPARLLRSAIVLKPSTIMRFHRSQVHRKYQRPCSPNRHGKPGPKGPSAELSAAILDMKRRNPRFGCRRIAEHFRRRPSGGVSWLTFLGHSKDSLWSLDLFRCESLFLRSHWVMVVMDQCSRRIIGFAVHVGVLVGPGVCRTLGQSISGAQRLPARR